jgi:outer membrane PBP1 activator LpoA protein
MKHYFKFFALFILTLILASCATKPQYSPQGVSEAEQLYLSKQYTEAALAFKQQANATSGTDQTLLLLRAVISYAKAEQLTLALQLFHSIQINENDLKQTSLARLTHAHIALTERNAEEVLLQLNKPLAKDSSTILLAEFHELRATAFSMQGDRMTTAEEYVLQGNYLTEAESILRNQQLTWQALALLSERSLQQMQPAAAPDVLSGWMELVRLSKKYQLSPTLLRAAIDNWQRRYTNHPVHLALIEGLRTRKQEDVA